MVRLIGQVARGQAEREAFQEVDFRRMRGEMAKWVAQIDDEARVAEYINHAFHLAISGRPGPVVLALPEDMLRARAAPAAITPAAEIQAHPGAEDMETLRGLLSKAQLPLLILGGGGWNAEACGQIQALAEANDLPVAVTFRCQDRFDTTHPNYIGELGSGPKAGASADADAASEKAIAVATAYPDANYTPLVIWEAGVSLFRIKTGTIAAAGFTVERLDTVAQALETSGIENFSWAAIPHEDL